MTYMETFRRNALLEVDLEVDLDPEGGLLPRSLGGHVIIRLPTKVAQVPEFALILLIVSVADKMRSQYRGRQSTFTDRY
jgi:hypothetical protein